MKSLHQEFSENLVKFDKVYKIHLNNNIDIETIMSIETKSMSGDSLVSLMTSTNINYTFDPFQGIYNSIINSGKIELIYNDVLNNKISRIQDLIMDYQEDEDEVRRLLTQNVYPFLLKHPLRKFNRRTDNEEKIKENYIKIIESFEYNNLMLF